MGLSRGRSGFITAERWGLRSHAERGNDVPLSFLHFAPLPFPRSAWERNGGKS